MSHDYDENKPTCDFCGRPIEEGHECEPIQIPADKIITICESVCVPSQKAVWTNADLHGWHNPSADLNTDLLLIHSEISEACEEARKGNLTYDLHHSSVEEELADAVIRIFHVAQKNGFDIAGAVWSKHYKNIKRPYKHGGKLF